MRKEVCEACRTNILGRPEVLWHLCREGEEYTLCSYSLDALLLHSLTPTQFHGLLGSGHTPEEFLLHADFYDQDGDALRPWVRSMGGLPEDLTDAVSMAALATVLKAADDFHVMRSANPEDKEAYYRLTRWLKTLEKLRVWLEASLEVSEDETADEHDRV